MAKADVIAIEEHFATPELQALSNDGIKQGPVFERLNDLEAMDLEGTGITDAGLDHLRPLKQLRFLVLRRTKVTTSGVQRLQSDLRKTLIWY